RSGGVIRGIKTPGQAGISRGQADQLTEIVKGFGAKGLVWIALQQDGDKLSARSPIAKFLSDDEVQQLANRLQAGVGDLLLLVADQPEVAATSLGRLRSHLGKQLGLIDESVHAF